MNTQPAVLLYNFNDPDRLRIIRRYLNRQKVKVRIVTTPEFLHPLGYLFELPGFQPCAQFNLGKNFSEEMMVPSTGLPFSSMTNLQKSIQ